MSPDIEQTIAEVLRLDAGATPGPWEWSPPSRGSCGGFPGVCTFGRDAVYAQAYGDPPDPEDAALIAYYRAAAPALARELERLQREVEDAHAEVKLLRAEFVGSESRVLQLGDEAERQRAEVRRWRRLSLENSKRVDRLMHPKCDHCERELELDAEYDRDGEIRCCSLDCLDAAVKEANGDD